MTHCLEKLGPISQCRCGITQRNSLLQRSENLKTRSLGCFEGFNRCLLSLFRGILLHHTVSSAPSGSSDLHIKSGTCHRLANGNTLRKTRHLYQFLREITTGRERYGTLKVQFTEIIYFHINSNVWCS